jgi:serine/threonine protein kinase
MLLMDAIPGESGDKFFERLARYYQSGKLTSEEYFGAIQFINAGVLKAIDHIQKAGLVHSDIKPENIIISRDTLEAKVIDLGVAQQRGSHTMAGTPGFMSMDHEINDIGMTQKSDVYSSAAMVVDAMEGLGKLRRDPLRSRWKPADPNDGALCRTYLTPLLPNANPADYREVKAFNKEKYLKRRMNRVFTSYSHFVNKQLLGVDPFTGNMLRSQPAARDTAAEALKHPFFSDGVQMDEALARKVAEKVFKLMAEEDAVPGPMPPQLPELKFAKTLLSTQSDMIFHLLKEREDFLLNPTLEGLVHLQNFAKAHDLPETKTDFSTLLTGHVASKLRRERDQLLAELLPEPAWLSAVETLYRNQDKIKSNIKFYDRSGAPEPNQETTTPVDEGSGNNQNKKRKAPNGYFPGNAFDVRERGIMKEHLREDNIDATARNIRRYVHDANRLFKGHSFIPDGHRSLAEVKQDMATIAKRVGIAQDFLQRHERSAPASMAFSRPARKDIPVPVKVKKDASTTAKRRADSKH